MKFGLSFLKNKAEKVGLTRNLSQLKMKADEAGITEDFRIARDALKLHTSELRL